MIFDELMNYIKKHKKVTVPEVQREFGLKYGETREAFRKLETEGKIRYVEGLTFAWCLIDEQERLELIKRRRKELEEAAKLDALDDDDEDDDDIDLDELLEALGEDDDEDDENSDWKKLVPSYIKDAQRKKGLVTLHDMLNGDEYKNSKGKLTFVVGKDTNGKDIVTDLTNLPHLLIAGMTGSGKSTVLNSLIVSLANKYSPDYVKFLLIDTKFAELTRYDGMPHMLTRESIKTSRDAFAALDYLKAEMEHRYDLFRSSGVGNIVEYNTQSKEQLPYIVCAIEEIADIMDYDKRLFEVRLIRLAQKCRASGIHLVLATHRPDVKTISGTVKASIPARIALTVCSKFDSVTIIGNQGAEQLKGRGDMLFYDATFAEPIRVQGAFVSSEEIRIAVNEFKKKYLCKFNKDVESAILSSKINSTATVAPTGNTQVDPLCRKALRFWLEKQGGRASIASLQRNLGIGFNRAGRIMDYCQKMGYVEQPGPNDPIAKPLMVLVIIDDLPRLFPDQED